MSTQIKHVKGNVLSLHIPLTIQIRTMVDGQETVITEDFYPSPDYPTYVVLKKSGGLDKKFKATVDGYVASMVDMGTLSVGLYQLEVLCSDNDGNPYRYMVRAIIDIVDATIDAGIVAGIEFDSEEYTLDAGVFAIAKGEKGDRGDDGASAYDIAVAHGFVGTEEEWINSVGFNQYEGYIFVCGNAPEPEDA